MRQNKTSGTEPGNRKPPAGMHGRRYYSAGQGTHI
nr:MAG TPA: hypothetical protein [Caudoviricetes sp.]